jgi:microcystin-dependent protein
MKKLLTLLLLIASAQLMAQNVGINTDGSAPHTSAMLEVKSTTGGLLIPRMTEEQRTQIQSPAQGLMVYQTTSPAGFYYFDGSSWALIGGTAGSETDPVFTASPAHGITGTNITNWNTAYGWGNHANAGYLTSLSETDPIFGAHAAYGITGTNITNWNTAYGWGNHANAGYLTSLSETDPIFGAHAAYGITGTNIGNWNTAYGWGNHASAGYLTSATLNETDPNVPDYVKSITSTEKSNWNTAYGWGNHASAGYLTAATLSETDPVYIASPAYGIDNTNISTWNALVSSQWTTATNDIYYNTGSVAIGTTTPGAYKLNVAGSINGTSVLVNGVAVASSTDTYWETAGSGKIYYNSGNVGIGVANPAYPLDVTGDVNITGNFRVNGTPLTGTGTVTSVSAGNGMDFTAITGSGSVTLGTPSTLTSATTNSVSGTTHTHAITTQLPSSTTAGVMLHSGSKTAGGFYGGITAPSSTTRANYDGYLYATRFYGDGSQLTGITGSTTATNLAGGVAGSIPWQSAAGTTGFTAAGTSGYILKSNGTTAPTWLQTLPVANGGTGTTTAPSQGGVIYASSTSAYASTAAGTTGQVLKSNGTSAPTWTTPTTGTVTSVSGTSPISVATGTTTPAISISAATTSAAGSMSAADKTKLDGIATGANNYTHPTGDGNLHVPATSTTNSGKVLTAGATAGSLSWTTPTTGTVTSVTGTSPISVATGTSTPVISLGTVPVANGGTGSTTATVAGGVVYGASTTAMASTAAGTSGQVLTSNGSSAPTWTTIGVAPTGSIMIWAGSSAPAGWLLCDGTLYSNTTYAALYAIVGTTYGSGTGTFAVPNLKGKIPVGIDAADAAFNTRGETGGQKTHTIVTAELPAHNHGVGTLATASDGSHTHSYTAPNNSPTGTKVKNDGCSDCTPITPRTVAGTTGSGGAHSHTMSGSTANTGSGTAMNVLQPYIALYYIIKY